LPKIELGFVDPDDSTPARGRGRFDITTTPLPKDLEDDREATLFGFDEQGHVYIHEATCRSIRQLWEQLFAGPPTPTGAGTLVNGPTAAGFAPPHLGPGEEVAAQMPAAESLAP
jgi:hypothetical protein